MDTCKHVNKLSPALDHSILNPEKWLCSVCGTTESVWACMSCPHVACGRYNEEHAVHHFQSSKHPLAIEVNERYVYCYICDEYVLNDNAAGDLKILRSALDAVAKQTFQDIGGRGRRILRSRSFHGYDPRDEKRYIKEDQSSTALWFRRYNLLGKCFAAWRKHIQSEKKIENDFVPDDVKGNGDSCDVIPVKKKAILPGITGLRNLGNTCYMNSILQVLSHLMEFRMHFLEMKAKDNGSNVASEECQKIKPSRATKPYMRQSTLECFQHVSSGSSKETVKGGLNGGSSSQTSPAPTQKRRLSKENEQPLTLSQEIHALFRVMWSGKWVLVSPHKMLYAVWQLIPFFKGFAQQDAQEFLCELLDKLDGELNRFQASPSLLSNSSASNVLSDLFEGQLISEVRCRACGNTSQTQEPFYELSLEFPDQYQTKDSGEETASKEPCPVEEMLGKFTEVEKLDGEIYACERCNQRRRSTSQKPTIYREAEKGLKVSKLPRVLRLHLKRFMWSGRNHRGKINVHVKFSGKLNMQNYCHKTIETTSYSYKLSAVVMHHGKGFGSGHYTSYCYNEEARTWVHCNDSRLELVPLSEVTKAQAYLLFYTHCPQPNQQTHSENIDEDITFNFVNSNIPKIMSLKRKMSSDTTQPKVPLKRSKSVSF